MSAKESVRLAEGLPFWPHLSQEERALVTSRGKEIHYRKGDVIRSRGLDCPGMLHILSGTLRTYLLSFSGKEVTLYRLRQGESCVLAASCVLDAVTFETQVEAEEPSRVYLLPADAFAALMRSNVYVERDAYRLTTERFSSVVGGMERFFFLTIEQRLLSFLLDEAVERGTDALPMTHEQIATSIGSAREVVSRALKGMAEKGWVELYRGGIRLRDRASLYPLVR